MFSAYRLAIYRLAIYRLAIYRLQYTGFKAQQCTGLRYPGPKDAGFRYTGPSPDYNIHTQK